MTSALTFNESAGLVVITAVLGAGLTGFLAPYVVQRTTRRRIREEKRFEEDLRRETAFVTAQAELLRDLGAALWAFQAKGLAVSYTGAYNPGRLDTVWEEYDSEAFALLGEINSCITTASTLFSETTCERLQRFYDDWLKDEFDEPLSRMAQNPATQQSDWRKWHNPHHQKAEDATAALLTVVADEAGLSYRRRRGAETTQ